MTGARLGVALCGAAALSIGAAQLGGVVAALFGLAGGLALIATVCWPRWVAGPTLVAAALIGQAASATDPRWWQMPLQALLLAGFLGVSELGQTRAWRAGWRTASRQHGLPVAAAAGIAAVLVGMVAVPVSGTVAASVGVGLTAAAAVALVLVLRARVSTDDPRPPPAPSPERG